VSEHLLRTQLLTALTEWDRSLDGDLQGDAPLVSSARLDSLNLLRLLLWIEEQIGRPIDATKVDLAAEWDTIDDIVAFVERERGRN
jgi:acyl carrier protein